MSHGSEILYDNAHNIEIVDKNGSNNTRNILIKVSSLSKCLQVKLRDLNDFSFNFTSNIDWSAFETMKIEQCLEICYEEFYVQLVNLLKQTTKREMLLRLELLDLKCRMVFYERSRIKSLIFLVIDLYVTNEKEIIDEMSSNIAQLKDLNHSVNSQVSALKCQLQEKDILLNTALTTNHHLEKQFLQDMKCIENTFTKDLSKIESVVSFKVNNLFKRHVGLLSDVNKLKKGLVFKDSLYSQTLMQLDSLRTENLLNLNTIDKLRSEINVMNNTKMLNEKIFMDQRQDLISNKKEIEKLNSTINELKNDMQEATKIISQKAKTHDEIAKDLVQANTMLVNFNNQYDLMSKEMHQLRHILASQEKTVEDQSVQIKQMGKDHEDYKKQYNAENIDQLRFDLHRAKERIEELEKQNREAAKINALLTKKIANGEVFEARNMNWMHPK